MLSDLALPEEMEFEQTTLEQRKIHVRDILSSFDRFTLPSEYRKEDFARITGGQAARPQLEWTVLDDFVRTMMQRGCHEPITWKALNSCQTAGNRARLFVEKLNRRFRQEFEHYEDVRSLEDHGQGQSSTRTAEIHYKMVDISGAFHSLADAALIDLSQRSEGKAVTLDMLLGILTMVCERHDDVASVPRSSLSYFLIHRTPAGGPGFMLDALGYIKDISTRIPMPALLEMTRKLQGLEGLLQANQAPTYYQVRLREILNAAVARAAPAPQ